MDAAAGAVQGGRVMSKWINADAVNVSLDRIREEVWLHDIPSPTVPEYIEHHDAIQQIMLVIDKERKLLSDAATDAIPCEVLERYADWFCAGVPYPEFVREARQFYESTYRAMDGGVIDTDEVSEDV